MNQEKGGWRINPSSTEQIIQRIVSRLYEGLLCYGTAGLHKGFSGLWN